ncbi:hypothetical protein [Sphingopyxis sp. BSNA05]|uniref:hypothetical protein n=1 Tax=Sphingopyxis sp. BSNA05 TaxID=1236614 RepID=UPI00156421A8|nr:hypothetical protein [Sphingopyxis sp. BSNA05]
MHFDKKLVPGEFCGLAVLVPGDQPKAQNQPLAKYTIIQQPLICVTWPKSIKPLIYRDFIKLARPVQSYVHLRNTSREAPV